jgi:dTDP-4-dehydrorhamnose reductase
MSRAISILQFGTTGQLSRALIAANDASANKFRLTAVSRTNADFTKPETVARILHADGPFDVVINAVAYTAVDRAERDEGTARLVNTTSVATIAKACADLEIPLIHFSTDYVFNGTKIGTYDEFDEPRPLNAYGRTKLDGENAIRRALSQHVILRTSWLYSSKGTNFVKTMLKLGGERDVLRIINDQHGSPTSASDLAGATLKIARAIAEEPNERAFGTFHYCGHGTTTWFEFANAIFEESSSWNSTRAQISPTSSADYGSTVQRPQNSKLNCEKVDLCFGISRRHWRDSLRSVLSEIKLSQS